MIDSLPVWGVPVAGAVEQMQRCRERADYAALMADHHLGYAVPVGGVIAYAEHLSPSGVGFDIFLWQQGDPARRRSRRGAP